MTLEASPDRCRVVLVAPPLGEQGINDRILSALAGGDVAALILPTDGIDEAAFQRAAESLVEPAQKTAAAVLVADEPRLAFRLKADGVHMDAPRAEIADAVARHGSGLMIGCNAGKTRDDALEIGELQPDYVFFGRFGYDNKPEPHRRNLALAEWWSQMVAVPCVVLGGGDIASVEQVAATGADFVALSAAAFASGRDPAEAVAEANARLDASAPRFERG